MDIDEGLTEVDDFVLVRAQFEGKDEYTSCASLRHEQPVDGNSQIYTVEVSISDVCRTPESSDLQEIGRAHV